MSFGWIDWSASRSALGVTSPSASIAPTSARSLAPERVEHLAQSIDVEWRPHRRRIPPKSWSSRACGRLRARGSPTVGRS
jgi:hypothetical protein